MRLIEVSTLAVIEIACEAIVHAFIERAVRIERISRLARTTLAAELHDAVLVATGKFYEVDAVA